MPDPTRHAASRTHPLAEPALWLAWRLCALPLLVISLLAALAALTLSLVEDTLPVLGQGLRTGTTRLAARPDAPYVGLLAGVVVWAVLLAAVTRP